MEDSQLTSVDFCKTFPDQDVFAKQVLDAKQRNYIFAGDIRSGKTIVCLMLLIIFCRVYPGSRWAVVRENRPKLLKTTLPTLFKYCCPSNFIRDFNKSELIFTATNNSQIMFLSEQYEHDPELTSFWGLEVNGFFLNQGDELTKEMFNMSIMRRGQWKIDPMPPAFTLVDTNPTDNWLKDFYDMHMRNELPPEYYFQLADMEKNPYITDEYKKDLKDTLPEDLYLRFCKNNWDVVQITEANKASIFVGCIDVYLARRNRRIIGDEANDISAHTPQRCNRVARPFRLNLEKVTVVTQLLYQNSDVDGRIEPCR